MAETFEELGIASELAAGAASMGWAVPSGLQRDALPILRRGNNAVLYASAGAGATGAYVLGLLDRLLSEEAGEGSPRALVVVPDASLASGVASCMARLAADTGTAVRALAPGWPDRPTDVLVASAEAAGAAVRDSSLKLDGLLTLVVHGADLLAATRQWDTLEVLLEATPASAQRVLVTARFDAATDSLIERHVRRAMTVPPRPADPEGIDGEPVATVRYHLAPEREKTAAVAELVAAADAGEIAIACRTAARAEQLMAALGARGVSARGVSVATDPSAGEGDGDDRRILALPFHEADQRSTRATVISYDVPFDAESFGELHARGGSVLVTPSQLPHLHQVASRARVALERIRPRERPTLGPAEVVRMRLRETVQRGDLAADLALIEPLLDEFSATELAAAALQLARAAGVAHPAAEPGQAEGGATRGASAQRPGGAAAAPPPTLTWVRLFVSGGSRDGLGPGDLVGAITGETGLQGAQVGKIDVRESHSTVEVPTESAAAVIQALNGRSLKGRSLRVDYDRRERTPRRGPPRGGPRGTGGAGGPGRRPRPGGGARS
jgi:ATP-dependent RNA helicase DeaD